MTARPLLLDLFAGAGGSAMGYHRAGFDVIGVDIHRQPNYPFRFVRADALDPPFDLSQFDAVHASPPCQAWSTITPDPSRHPQLIAPVRDMLEASGRPYIIENVEGARGELVAPIKLCGSAFGLRVRRHRYFESNVALWSMPCNHVAQGRPTGVYGDHGQDDHEYRRPDGTRRGAKAIDASDAREALGMDWGDWRELAEAIPPPFTEFIGSQLLAHLGVAAWSSQSAKPERQETRDDPRLLLPSPRRATFASYLPLRRRQQPDVSLSCQESPPLVDSSGRWTTEG